MIAHGMSGVQHDTSHPTTVIAGHGFTQAWRAALDRSVMSLMTASTANRSVEIGSTDFGKAYDGENPPLESTGNPTGALALDGETSSGTRSTVCDGSDVCSISASTTTCRPVSPQYSTAAQQTATLSGVGSEGYRLAKLTEQGDLGARKSVYMDLRSSGRPHPPLRESLLAPSATLGAAFSRSGVIGTEYRVPAEPLATSLTDQDASGGVADETGDHAGLTPLASADSPSGRSAGGHAVSEALCTVAQMAVGVCALYWPYRASREIVSRLTIELANRLAEVGISVGEVHHAGQLVPEWSVRGQAQESDSTYICDA